MLDRLLAVLTDPHFEAYVGGPLMGVLAGSLFASMGKSPSTSMGHVAPKDIYIQIHQRTSTVNNYTARNTHSDQSSNGGEIFAIGLIGIVAVFLFTAYLPEFSLGLYFIITTVSAFTLTCLLVTLISGRFNTLAWWSHSLFPAAAALACFPLAYSVEKSIDPQVIQFAQNLVGTGQLSISRIISGATTFATQISSEGFKWMALQMTAFMMTLFASFFALMQCIYYAALSNLRGGGSAFWLSLVRGTARYSGLRTVASGSVCLLLAWFLASGRAYQFLS